MVRSAVYCDDCGPTVVLILEHSLVLYLSVRFDTSLRTGSLWNSNFSHPGKFFESKSRWSLYHYPLIVLGKFSEDTDRRFSRTVKQIFIKKVSYFFFVVLLVVILFYFKIIVRVTGTLTDLFTVSYSRKSPREQRTKIKIGVSSVRN